jgi:eukaryotic-like serine/threonine-protein kinase
VNVRGAVRRFLPYVLAIVGGFVLAYLLVAFVVFPAGIVPRDVKVPNVVGLDYGDAVRRLEQAGFKTERGETRFNSSAPKMTVLEQTPAAGSNETVGGSVSLAVSGGQKMGSVPAIVGMTQTDAERMLEAAGFDVGDVTEQPGDQPRGQVIATRPSPGAQIPMPGSVALVVSAGPNTVLTPDVVGRNFAEARQLLEQVGLALGDVTAPNGGQADASALVMSQSPAAGSQVARGSRINLQVGGPR